MLMSEKKWLLHLGKLAQTTKNFPQYNLKDNATQSVTRQT